MREIILSNANENWYIILYDLFSRLWYIATCGPFCKDATHMKLPNTAHNSISYNIHITIEKRLIKVIHYCS